MRVGGSSELCRQQVPKKSKPGKIMPCQGLKGTWSIILTGDRTFGFLLLPMLCCAPTPLLRPRTEPKAQKIRELGLYRADSDVGGKKAVTTWA